MSNELVFFAVIIINLAVLLLAWRLGRAWLELFIVVNYMINSFVIGKLFEVFGLNATLSAVTYSTIFIGTDILTEHHGKKAGYRVVWMGFFAAVFLVWMEQVALYLDGLASTAAVHGAMHILFATSASYFTVSLITYLIAQRFDIWLFHWLHLRTHGRFLWLRNNISTFVSQAVSGIVFGTCAYLLEIFPREEVIEVMLVAYLMNVIFAALDTPAIYLSYWVRQGNDGAPLRADENRLSRR